MNDMTLYMWMGIITLVWVLILALIRFYIWSYSRGYKKGCEVGKDSVIISIHEVSDEAATRIMDDYRKRGGDTSKILSEGGISHIIDECFREIIP